MALCPIQRYSYFATWGLADMPADDDDAYDDGDGDDDDVIDNSRNVL